MSMESNQDSRSTSAGETTYKSFPATSESIPQQQTVEKITHSNYTAENKEANGISCNEDEIVCRICQDQELQEKLVSACQCRGTMEYVHLSCLERWLAESNNNVCELCGFVFKTARIARFSARTAILMWITRPQIQIREGARIFRSDCISCCVLTPLIFIGIYFCIQAADYYYREDSTSWPPAKWTTAGLFSLVALVVVFYYLWVYVVFR